MRKNFGSNTWFYPLPVLIIGTYDENNHPNAMNAAWGGIYDTNEVIICLSDDHKTTKNILLKKAFTLSFADKEHVAESDYFGIVSGNKEPNKLAKVNFHTTKSEFVDAPIIDEYPMTLECEYLKQTEDGIIIGKIVNISADERIIGEDGKIDVHKLQPISFDPCHNEYCVLGENVGKAFSDGKKIG